MSQSAQFFEELKDFLPKFVSLRPSYVHAFITFCVVMIIGNVMPQTSIIDLEDENMSETAQKRAKYVYYAGVLLFAFFVGDTAFSVSWRLRNKKVNGLHMTWRKWLPILYGA